MLKKIVFFFIILFGYFFISKYKSIESDSCEAKCDNCINSIQCEECYNDCYSTMK